MTQIFSKFSFFLVILGAFFSLVSCARTRSETAFASAELPSFQRGEPEPSAGQHHTRLIFLTDLEGTLAPCGCTSHPKGGIDRIAHAVDELRTDRTSLVVAGNTLSEEAGWDEEGKPQEVLEAITMMNAIDALQPSAMFLGARDRAHAADFFASHAVPERFHQPLSAVESDAAAWLTLEDQAIVGSAIIDSQADAEEVRNQASRHRSNGLPIVVVARGNRRWIRALDSRSIDFILVVERDFAPNQEVPAPARGQDSTFIYASAKGESVLALDIFGLGASWEDASEWTRKSRYDALTAQQEELQRARARTPNDIILLNQSQRNASELARASRPSEVDENFFVAHLRVVDDQTPPSPSIQRVVLEHDRRLNETNRVRFTDRLPRPAAASVAHFVGSASCSSCHSAASRWWQSTGHGNAYATLQNVNKEFNLQCVGCHVTGYEQPGGSTVTHVQNLENVGCESCHGAGSQHIASPSTASLPRMIGPATCLRCHTPEHSDRFDYPVYLSHMRVPGHGLPE